MNKQAAVITGVSTGIGKATAELLLQSGFHVFGSVRSANQGDELKKALGDAFTPLIFDVTDEKAIKKAADQVKQELGDKALAGLVNNAGIAVSGAWQHLPVENLRKQLEVNIVGPLLVTQAFLPLLGAQENFSGTPGRIVNISSVAGRLSFPFLGPYAVSKHGLEAFSDSLRRELQLFGIDVIVVGPGAVATPIWDKAENEELSPYKQTPYFPAIEKFSQYILQNGRKGLPALTIAETVLKALTKKNPRVRYAVVPRFVSGWLLPLLLPKRLIDKNLAKVLGLSKK